MSHQLIQSLASRQAEFMRVMGSPTMATHGVAALELANDLIIEECKKELLPALDKYMQYQSLENLAELADGIVDTVYVVLQLSNAIGLPFDALFNEVHRSNMAKIHPDGTVKRREDGKVLKPEGWQPPNLHAILLDWQTKQQYGQRYMDKGTVA